MGKYKNSMIFWQIDALLEKYDADVKTPVKDLPEEALNEILNGSMDRVRIKSQLVHTSSDYYVTYEGLMKYIQMMQENETCGFGTEVGGTVLQDGDLSGIVEDAVE